MLVYDIPGVGTLEIEHLVVDLNGTIAEDGVLIDGVAELIARLAEDVRVVVVTADTHGRAQYVRDELGCDVHVLAPGGEVAQKLAFVRELGASRVAAIGAGANDVEMLEAAGLGICVVGTECACGAALRVADLVAPDVLAALRTLAEPGRLVATMRR